MIDARPILPMSPESLWSTASAKQTELCAEIERFLKENQINTHIIRSQPGEFPYSIEVKFWVPINQSSNHIIYFRSSLKITTIVRPEYIFPFEFDVKVETPKRNLQRIFHQLNAADLDQILRSIFKGDKKKPKFFLLRNRVFDYIFNRNKLIPEAKSLISWLWLGVFVSSLAGIGYFVDSAFDVLSLLLDHFEWSLFLEKEFYREIFPLFAFIGFLSGLIASIVVYLRRPTLSALPKQPPRAPRREFLVDSWQVSVPQAGQDLEGFQGRIMRRVAAVGAAVQLAHEAYDVITPRGFETRDRHVASHGQGNVHIHIRGFGNDAFVGWESYLNWARWAEGVVSVTTVKSGNRIEYTPLSVGAHIPSRADLHDLNAFAEIIHFHIVEEIRLFLKEREIQADLDFSILRGDRQEALNQGKNNGNNNEPKVRLRSRRHQ